MNPRSIYLETDQEAVIQPSVFTRRGVDRVMRYAFEQARKRRQDVPASGDRLTPDLGGSASTTQLTDAILESLQTEGR